MKRKTITKVLSILSIGLLFIPLLPTISSDNHLLLSKDDSSLKNDDNLTMDLYKKHRLPEGYQETSLHREQYVTHSVQKPTQNTGLKSAIAHDSSMDSPWPIYCHDTKHTGRSPYNTGENPMTEIWRFSLNGFTSHCAPVLDSSGTIYIGRKHFYAIYPNGTLKWEFEYEKPIEGCPAIDEQRGVLYFGTEWDSPNYLYALYLSNGSIKWKYSTGNHITSSPAIDPFGNIYFGDWNGNVHAVYPNGTRKWIYHTGDVITSSPAIGDDGTIYIGSHDDYVYAFYSNGTVKWRFQTGNWVHASPTIGSDGKVYIGSDDMYLYALNTENGAEIWRCSIGGGTWCSPTLDKQGIIYLGTFTMKFHAIYPNGTIKWTYDAPGRIWFGSSAALSNDGILYFGTTWMDGGEGAFIALNSKEGTEHFTDYFGKYETSPAIASDGTIYAVTSDEAGDYGILHAFGSLDSNAPIAPVITGQTHGKLQTIYSYTFTSTSPLGNQIYYLVDWGDGTTTDWIGPYNSGETLTLNHSWVNKGTYTIKARAKDTDNNWGPWGELKVRMPFSFDIPFLQFWMKILERFPNVFPIFRYLLGF
jgi:outer membrane protein assembly factor BamB